MLFSLFENINIIYTISLDSLGTVMYGSPYLQFKENLNQLFRLSS